MSNSGLNQESFLRLFLQYEDDLKSYARSLLPTRDAVSEVMQEASVVIWEKQDQLRHEDEFLPWAKTIVRNISFRHRRKLFRDRHVFDDGLVERILAEEEAEQDGGDQASREYGALMSCLNKLPEERKQLILAPYRDPGAVKELAEQGSRSPNSLYKLLQRLRVKLMHCVEAELNSEPVIS
jgi:RNA polymerase sigma-70 factor (ECF subfamily)